MTYRINRLIESPNRLFTYNSMQLKQALSTAPSKELKIFLDKVTEAKWIENLPRSQQQRIPIKIIVSLSRNIEIEDLIAFLEKIENLNLPLLSEEDKAVNIAKEIPIINPEIMYQVWKFSYKEESDLMLIYRILKNGNEKVYIPFFNFLLSQEISLTEEYKEMDLLDIALKFGNPESLIKIVDYYKCRMAGSEFIAVPKKLDIIAH